MLETVRLYVRFTRPFTLLPPLLGVVSGAITAWGSASNPHVLAGQPRQWTWSIVSMILLGSACAALLNAASNVINQYYDLENDRSTSRPVLITGRSRWAPASGAARALRGGTGRRGRGRWPA
jgi:4-hydroxybenzoate polyprenyltransferase